jgi:hypothetical protein
VATEAAAAAAALVRRAVVRKRAVPRDPGALTFLDGRVTVRKISLRPGGTRGHRGAAGRPATRTDAGIEAQIEQLRAQLDRLTANATHEGLIMSTSTSMPAKDIQRIVA